MCQKTSLMFFYHRMILFWRCLLDDSQIVRSREAAAMVATARWMYNSGLQRQETRGMHKREDYPQQDPNQQYRLLSGGLDKIWVKPESVVATRELVTV
jgi:succinate dehydrogenase/fumarate reductase flavoprotein subunit